MPDYSILKNHAIQNVWCDPSQDKQLTFKTSRVTPISGSRNYFKVMQENHQVPQRGSKFHIFKIATLPESVINLSLSYQWTKVSSLCNINNMVIDVYLEAGLMLPKSECWIKNTDNGSLLLAFKQDRLVEFNRLDEAKSDVLINHVPYVKFYTSKYFSVNESMSNPRDVHVYGKKIEVEQDIIDFAIEFEVHRERPGALYGYINGIFQTQFVPGAIRIGDYAEIVYDSAVIRERSFPLSDIPTFTSDITGDDRHFLIPHHTYDKDIWFYDDIDFYLVSSVGPLQGTGLYINRNSQNNVRMMTHQGFSFSDELIQSLMNSTMPALSSSSNLSIHMVQRNSGLNRKLIPNKTRLNRFMLFAALREDASDFRYENDLPLDEWKYRNIEKASVNQLYGVRYDKMSDELVKDSYGYHSAARSLAPPNQQVIIDVDDGSRSIELSHLYLYGVTIFEYNSLGELLEFNTHTGVENYLVTNEDTAWVELVTGLATDGDLVATEDLVFEMDDNFEYRFFKGNTENVFTDVTGTPDYNKSGTTVTWTNVGVNETTLVVNDKYFYCAETVVDPEEPVLTATIGYYVGEGASRTFKAFPVPSAEVDVWLNNKPLVENIDYFVVWPRVVVTNKTNVSPRNQSNTLLVRARGHGLSTMEYESATDSGFIKYGLFSNNDQYDVHWDQSLKVVINGRSILAQNILYKNHHDETVYIPFPGVFESEETKLDRMREINLDGVVTVMGIDPNHSLNGKPYSIRDSYTGLTAATPGSTRDFREEMINMDKRISQYLTEKFPEEEPSVPNVISEKYAIVSPYLAACADGLFDEEIDEAVWNKHDYDVQEILAETSEFVWLLDGDPTQDHIYHDLDMEIADIHAHPYYEKLPVTFNQYRFLEFVADTILHNRVDVSRFFTIGEVEYVEPPLNFVPHFYDEFDAVGIETRAVKTGQFMIIPSNKDTDGIHEAMVGDHDGVNAMIPNYALPDRRLTRARWGIRDNVDGYRFFENADFTIDFYHYMERPDTDNGSDIPLSGSPPLSLDLAGLMKFSMANLTYREAAHASLFNDVEEVGSDVVGIDRDNWVYSFYNDGAFFPTYKKVIFNEWQHVAIVADGVDLYLVVDGIVTWHHKDWMGVTAEGAVTFQEALVKFLEREENNHAFEFVTQFSTESHPDDRNGRIAIKHLRVTTGDNQLYVDDIRPDINGDFGSFDRPVFSGFDPGPAPTRTPDPATPPITIDTDEMYFHFAPDGTQSLIVAPSQSGHYAHDVSKTEYPRRARNPWNGGLGNRPALGTIRQLGPVGDLRYALSTRPTNANRKTRYEGALWLIEEKPLHALLEDVTDTDKEFSITMSYFFDRNGSWSTSTPLNVFLTEYLTINLRMDSTEGRFSFDHGARFETQGIGGEWYTTDIIEADAWNEFIFNIANDTLTISVNGVIAYEIPAFFTSIIIGKEYELNVMNSDGTIKRIDERSSNWVLVEGVAEFYEPFMLYTNNTGFSDTITAVTDVSINKVPKAPEQARGISYLESVLNPGSRQVGDSICLNVYDPDEAAIGYFYALSSRSDDVDGGVSEVTDSNSITGTTFAFDPGGEIRLGTSSTLPSISGGVLTNMTKTGIPMDLPQDLFFEIHLSLDSGITTYQPLLTPSRIDSEDDINSAFVLLAKSDAVMLAELHKDSVTDLEYYVPVEYVDGIDLTQDTVIAIAKWRRWWHVIINGVVVFARPAKPFGYDEGVFDELVLFGKSGFRNKEEAEILDSGSPGDPEYDAIVPYAGLSGIVEKAFYIHGACLTKTNHVINRNPVVFTGLYDPKPFVFTGTEYDGDEFSNDDYANYLIFDLEQVNYNEDRRYGGDHVSLAKGLDEYNYAYRTELRRRMRYGVCISDSYPVLGSGSDADSFYFSPGATALNKYFVDCVPVNMEMTNFIFKSEVRFIFERAGRECVVQSFEDMEIFKSVNDEFFLRINGSEVALPLPELFATRTYYNFTLETYVENDTLMMRFRVEGEVMSVIDLDALISRDDISRYRRCWLGASMDRNTPSDPYGLHVYNYKCYVNDYYVPKDKDAVADNPYYSNMGLFINGGDDING